MAGFIETAKANHPDWITTDGQIWTNEFFTVISANNTGLYERSEKDQILGPFEDVIEKPMQHALALTPQLAPDFNLGTVDPNDRTVSTAEPFTKDSAMCGTCHNINLPNIGESLANEKNPILRLLQPNPSFQNFPHSIEQATYLEWLNSNFGPGLNNEKGEDFQSCQDCQQLPTEFLQDPNVYQDHYQEICSEDRVQIYEELVKNKAGEFTTSFVHRMTHIKDNRLLPRGWVPGHAKLTAQVSAD